MEGSPVRVCAHHKLLILTLAITLWSWFSGISRSGEDILGDSLRSYKICVSNNISEKQCLDYFKIHTLERAAGKFSKNKLTDIHTCYAKQEERLSAAQLTTVSQSMQYFEECFLGDVLTQESKTFRVWPYIIILGGSILGWGLIKMKLLENEFQQEKNKIEDLKEQINKLTEETTSKQKMMTEQLNRTNQKVFELEYDNEIWEKIHEMEQVQTRVQLLLEQTKKELKYETSRINNNLSSLTTVSSKDTKSPFVIQEKEKGLLFDMTTKKGLARWRDYVSKSDQNEKIEIKAPQLTPLSFSPISPDLSKVNLFDKNGKPFRRVFLPGTGWVARDTCIQIMKGASSPKTGENTNSITY